MNIHTCRKVKLGFPDTWDWRQKNISVPYWRAYWNDAPGSFVDDGNLEIELGHGKVVGIPPRTVYSTRAESGSTHFYVHFSVEGPYSQIKPGLRVFESKSLVALAASIAAELSEKAPGAKTQLKTELYLCEMLLAIPDSELPAEKTFDPRVETALESIDAKPSLSNLELARMQGMSRTAFLDLFRRETGSAPQTLSRLRRLEKACMLLHFGEKTIKQIAVETGFCDRYHFGRVFKREYGCGPAEFRKQLDAFRT